MRGVGGRRGWGQNRLIFLEDQRDRLEIGKQRKYTRPLRNGLYCLLSNELWCHDSVKLQDEKEQEGEFRESKYHMIRKRRKSYGVAVIRCCLRKKERLLGRWKMLR